MNTPYTDRYLTANGVKLHFQDWGGTDKSEPLLMVHGVTMQSHAFDPAAVVLRQRYRCLALDLRGHGDSDHADPSTYHYAMYADDVLAFVDALGIKKVHYLGTSMGGRVAMVIGMKQSSRLASLVLNDISPEPSNAGVARIVEVFGGDKPPFPTVEAYVKQVVFAYNRNLQTLPLEAVAKSVRWNLKQVDGGFRPKFDPQVLLRASTPGALERDKNMLWQGFRNLDCPMLLLQGENSDIVSAEAASLMLAARPQLQVVIIPGVGHPPALTESASQQALQRFFP